MYYVAGMLVLWQTLLVWLARNAVALSKAAGGVQSGPTPLHPLWACPTGHGEAVGSTPGAWPGCSEVFSLGLGPPSAPAPLASVAASPHLADNHRRARAAASVSQQDLKAPWGQGSRMTDEL